MLKIHFTSEDVARTRIAARPDPLWELVMAVQMLRPQRGDVLFTGWRREATAALCTAGLGPRLRLLFGLTPTVGYFPDFLNPIDAAQGLEQGLEAIRSTPRSILRRDIGRLARGQRLPDGAQQIAVGDPRALARLVDTMRACYQHVVTPYQRNVDTAVDRDRSIRVNALANGGVEGLLRSLRPVATWSSGVLHIPSHRDQELHLESRGLLLIPSYFCLSGPLTLLDPTLSPVLIYPVERQPDALPGRRCTASIALGSLLGTTRAAVLGGLGTGHITTGDLARRLGISPASASEHTTVLRRAGLLTSHRDGQRMIHHLTRLGLTLLDTNK